MTKRELIDEIRNVNPTAMPEFLCGFDEPELKIVPPAEIFMDVATLRHLISRLKTAPTSLVVALSV